MTLGLGVALSILIGLVFAVVMNALSEGRGIGAALKWLVCWSCGLHPQPVRQPIGGWRCGRCGVAAASYDALGWDGGYVAPVRPPEFKRERYVERERSDG